MYNSLATLFGFTGQDLNSLSGFVSGERVQSAQSQSDFESFLARAVPVTAVQALAQNRSQNAQEANVSGTAIYTPQTNKQSSNQIQSVNPAEPQHTLLPLVVNSDSPVDYNNIQIDRPLHIPYLLRIQDINQNISSAIQNKPIFLAINEDKDLSNNISNAAEPTLPSVVVPLNNSFSLLDIQTLIPDGENNNGGFVLELELPSQPLIPEGENTLIVPARIVPLNNSETQKQDSEIEGFFLINALEIAKILQNNLAAGDKQISSDNISNYKSVLPENDIPSIPALNVQSQDPIQNEKHVNTPLELPSKSNNNTFDLKYLSNLSKENVSNTGRVDTISVQDILRSVIDELKQEYLQSTGNKNEKEQLNDNAADFSHAQPVMEIITQNVRSLSLPDSSVSLLNVLEKIANLSDTNITETITMGDSETSILISVDTQEIVDAINDALVRYNRSTENTVADNFSSNNMRKPYNGETSEDIHSLLNSISLQAENGDDKAITIRFEIAGSLSNEENSDIVPNNSETNKNKLESNDLSVPITKSNQNSHITPNLSQVFPFLTENVRSEIASLIQEAQSNAPKQDISKHTFTFEVSVRDNSLPKEIDISKLQASLSQMVSLLHSGSNSSQLTIDNFIASLPEEMHDALQKIEFSFTSVLSGMEVSQNIGNNIEHNLDLLTDFQRSNINHDFTDRVSESLIQRVSNEVEIRLADITGNETSLSISIESNSEVSIKNTLPQVSQIEAVASKTLNGNTLFKDQNLVISVANLTTALNSADSEIGYVDIPVDMSTKDNNSQSLLRISYDSAVRLLEISTGNIENINPSISEYPNEIKVNQYNSMSTSVQEDELIQGVVIDHVQSEIDYVVQPKSLDQPEAIQQIDDRPVTIRIPLNTVEPSSNTMADDQNGLDHRNAEHNEPIQLQDDADNDDLVNNGKREQAISVSTDTKVHVPESGHKVDVQTILREDEDTSKIVGRTDDAAKVEVPKSVSFVIETSVTDYSEKFEGENLKVQGMFVEKTNEARTSKDIEFGDDGSNPDAKSRGDTYFVQEASDSHTGNSGDRRDSLFEKPTVTQEFIDSNGIDSKASKAFDIQNVLRVQEHSDKMPTTHRQPEVWESKDLAEHLVRHAQMSLRKGVSEMQVRLVPPHLGKMMLRIQMEDNQMSAIVRVETQEAKVLLQNNLAQLRESIAEKGVDIQTFDVHVQQDMQQDLNQSRWMKNDREAQNHFNQNDDNLTEELPYDETNNQAISRNFGYNTMELVV